MTKDYCPGYYDVTAGGVWGYDIDEKTNQLIRETLEQNAYRELEEEMGIKDHDLIFYGMFPYDDERTSVWGSMWLCIVRDGTEIKIQETEVDCVELKTIEQVMDEYNNGVLYTEDGIRGLELLQERMKSNQTWSPTDYD